MQYINKALVLPQRNTPQLSQQTTTVTESPIIQVEHLIKRYKHEKTNAVDTISFAVTPGSLFALLGPNGAGKTTTISILTTTLSATSGTVQIAGYDALKQAKAVRAIVGIIFQKPSLDLHLTAEENIRFHATLYGLYPFRPSYRTMPPAYREQIEKLSTILGLREDLFRSVKTYSGGMKRKLEILRSLLHHPRVLFLDEPTAGLDPSSRRNLWDYLRLVREENGTTIFFTTHYLEEAEQADSICIMNQGKIVARGTPAQIKAELVKTYLLIDALNRDELRAELTHLHLPFTEMPQFLLPLHPGEIHATLKAIEVPLTYVQTHVPTLEDVYLDIIGEK
jgi:ABC-2 type transport system ATP-binding protein